MIKLEDYIKEHGKDSIKKLNIRVNYVHPFFDSHAVMRMIKLRDKRPLEILGGLALKHGNTLYILKYRRDHINLNKFEEPWEILTRDEFLSGIEKNPSSMPPKIDEEFYQNKYFIVTLPFIEKPIVL